MGSEEASPEQPAPKASGSPAGGDGLGTPGRAPSADVARPPHPEIEAAAAAEVVLRDLAQVTPRTTGDASTSTGPPPTGAARPQGVVQVTLVGRTLSDIEVPIAVMGCFRDHVLSGQNLHVDRLLGGLVHTVLEQKILGPDLGQMTCIPLARIAPVPGDDATAGKPASARKGVRARYLLCVGLGEAAHFSLNDYRFVFMKLLMAVRILGYDGFAVGLVIASRVSYRPERTLQAIFDGFADAFDRHGLVRGVVPESAWFAPARLILTEPDYEKFHQLRTALGHFESPASQGLRIEVEVKSPPRIPRHSESPDPDLDEDEAEEPVLRFSISAEPRQANAAGVAAEPSAGGVVPADRPAEAPALLPRSRRRIFRCSATTESAVIPVRLVEVDEYLVRRLVERMIGSSSLPEQERFGQLMSSYFLPEDFIRQIDGGTPLTLAVDTTTAAYPWEMAALKIDQEVRFLGADIGLTRQFSMLSAQPGVVPPINNRLDMLLIADPAPSRDGLALPRAREEGIALALTLARARKAWKNRLDLRLTIRIGSVDDGDPVGDDSLRSELKQAILPIFDDGDPLSAAMRKAAEAEIDLAARCDPIEILSLLLTKQFDVVHFAGHGIFDPAQDNIGWVFNRECVLSANEIFRVRQVPRLVFANACRSSQIEPGANPTPERALQNASLAEAFFLRGIENYIGAGWPVDDEAARDFAVAFYSLALGTDTESRLAHPDPKTLIDAMMGARSLLLRPFRGKPRRNDAAAALSTWGAYQHYGKGTTRLIETSPRGRLDER